MNTRDIAKLACRILALYFIITVLTSLPWTLSNLIGIVRENVDLMFFFVTLASLLANLAVGVILWWQTERVASWLVPTSRELSSEGLSLAVLQRLAFSVVGIVFVSAGLAGLAQYSASGFSATNSNAFGVGLVRSGVELVIGLWLLFGAGGLVNLLGRLEQNRIPQNDAQNNPEKEV